MVLLSLYIYIVGYGPYFRERTYSEKFVHMAVLSVRDSYVYSIN